MKTYTKSKAGLFFVLFLILNLSLQAQEWSITPTLGYQFSGAIQFQEGRLNFRNAIQYGVNVSRSLSPSSYVEFIYHRSETSALFESYIPGLLDSEFNLSIGYLQMGLMHETHDGPTRPFFMFTGGATHFTPKDPNITGEWQFSVTGGGGLRIFLSDRIALRLQARAMLPLFVGSGGFFCGIGGSSVNCGASLNAASSLLQGEVSAGLTFLLGDL